MSQSESKANKYLEAFQHLAKNHADLYEFPGNYMLVEELKESEFKTKAGIIISATPSNQLNALASDKPTFVKILLTGSGELNPDTKELEPYDVNPGDICLLPGTSIKRFSVYGKLVNYGEKVIGLALATDIQKRWKGEAAFNEYFRILNEAIEGSVQPSGQ